MGHLWDLMDQWDLGKDQGRWDLAVQGVQLVRVGQGVQEDQEDLAVRVVLVGLVDLADLVDLVDRTHLWVVYHPREQAQWVQVDLRLVVLDKWGLEVREGQVLHQVTEWWVQEDLWDRMAPWEWIHEE